LALRLEVSLFLSPILSLTYAPAASLVHRQENLTTSCTTAAANGILASDLMLKELSMMSVLQIQVSTMFNKHQDRIGKHNYRRSFWLVCQCRANFVWTSGD
jgi:hypothetical protein